MSENKLPAAGYMIIDDLSTAKGTFDGRKLMFAERFYEKEDQLWKRRLEEYKNADNWTVEELVKRSKLFQALAEEYQRHQRLLDSANQEEIENEYYYEQGSVVALAELAEKLFGLGEDEAVEKLESVDFTNKAEDN